MRICIGIISYLPEDNGIRLNRKNQLNILLDKCDEIFTNIPILIIAQN
jgi:hypothetical protein